MASQTLQACILAPPADRTGVEKKAAPQDLALVDLEVGESAVIDHLALPAGDEHFLMRLGFFPGAHIHFCRRAPLGDPAIYSVDGTHIALRAETARHIIVQRPHSSKTGEHS